MVSRILFLIAAGELVILGFLFILFNPATANTIILATTQKPETYTELYFENHQNLPKEVISNQKYSFAFTIHNLEYKDVNYPYIVFLEDNGQKTVIDKDTVFLKQGQYKTITEPFILTNPVISRGEIIVKLTDKNQQIDFWLQNSET